MYQLFVHVTENTSGCFHETVVLQKKVFSHLPCAILLLLAVKGRDCLCSGCGIFRSCYPGYYHNRIGTSLRDIQVVIVKPVLSGISIRRGKII